MADPAAIVITEYAAYYAQKEDPNNVGKMLGQRRIRQVTENRWLSYGDAQSMAVSTAASGTWGSVDCSVTPAGGGWYTCIVTSDFATTGVWENLF